MLVLSYGCLTLWLHCQWQPGSAPHSLCKGGGAGSAWLPMVTSQENFFPEICRFFSYLLGWNGGTSSHLHESMTGVCRDTHLSSGQSSLFLELILTLQTTSQPPGGWQEEWMEGRLSPRLTAWCFPLPDVQADPPPNCVAWRSSFSHKIFSPIPAGVRVRDPWPLFNWILLYFVTRELWRKAVCLYCHCISVKDVSVCLKASPC